MTLTAREGMLPIVWLAASLVAAPASAVDGALDREPAFVSAPESLARMQALRVCLRRTPGSPRVERASVWQLEATDGDGARLFLSEPVPLPGAGQFRCTELRHDDVRASAADAPLEIGLGVILEPGHEAHGLLPSTQRFEGAAPVPALINGDWVGKGADKFYEEPVPAPQLGRRER